ncbi:MAG: hypothetical protein M3R27_01685 [Bacteroidota bacterium]|nr:hypothetical protein [Bacteroidota bacterium]
MKKNVTFLTIAAFAAGTLFIACDNNKQNERQLENAAENVQEAQQDLNEAKDEYAEEWNEFRTGSDTRFQENDREITTMKERLNTDKKFKEKNEKTVIELETKNNEYRKRRDDFERENATTKDRTKWENFKAEFNHDMDELGAAIKGLGHNDHK